MSMPPPPPPPPPPHPEIQYHPYEYGSHTPAPSHYSSTPAPPPPPSPYHGMSYQQPYNGYNQPPPPPNSYNSGPPPPSGYNNNAPPPASYNASPPASYNAPPPASYNAPPPASYNAPPSSYSSPPPANYNNTLSPQPDYRVTSPMPAPRAQGTSNPAVDLEGLANMTLNSQPPPQNSAASQLYGGSGGFAGGFAVASNHTSTGEDIMASMRRVGSVQASGYAPPPPPAAQPPPPMTPAAPEGAPPLPTVKDLTAASPSTPTGQIAWCRDAVFLIERGTPGADSLATRATSILSSLAPSNSEAVYLRACLSASANPRQAFRDFEASARAGCHMAWFRLGRDYEQFGDNQHAKECFERGARVGVHSCFYRLGMAHLLGQLSINQDPMKAMDLLKRAADGATMYTPEPAYVYALLLMSEFTAPAPYTLPNIALPTNPLLTAKPYLVKAAQLHFPPAQYKIAHAHEFATYPFTYDALLSVEYYSKASQAGEREADMALSKWFLCGAEGAFERDEGLARVFAERAAGELASAMFAMGYYDEVGVGAPVNLEKARVWYTKAAEHGNTDAGERLKALSTQGGGGMGRAEHEKVMGDTLVRTRTNARMKAHNGPVQQQGPHRDVAGMVRKNTLEMAPPMPQAPYRPPPSIQPISQTPQPAAPQQQAPPPQQMPGRNRYSLADPGAKPRPHSQSPSRPATGRIPSGPIQPLSRPPTMGGSPLGAHANLPSAGPGPSSRPPTAASGRLPAGVAHTPQPAASSASKKPGPATFAEMGFQGGRAEEEKCVVM